MYLSSSREAKRIVWPDNMGGAFGQLVSAVLQQSEFPSENPHLIQLWRDSESWRIDCLPRAERLTALQGGTGIRRAEIWNAVGHLLDTLGQDRKFDKPRDLVASVSEGSYLQAQVDQFVNVVNICYERSQALQFGATHNIPSAVSRDAEPVVPGLGILTSTQPSHSFIMEVMLPAAPTLLRADTNELIALRESDPGAGYFERRSAWGEPGGEEGRRVRRRGVKRGWGRRKERWAESPSTDTEQELRQAIRQYADALIEKARGAQKKTILGFASQRGRKVIDSAVGAAVTLGTSRLGIPTEFSIISGIGSAFASDVIVSTLDIVKEGPYVPRDSHIVKVKSAPEINLPR